MSDTIKVAHFAPFTPRKQGMYETIRELVLAQNKIEGLESGLFDPTRPGGGDKDGDLTTVDHSWAMDADIYCISSILPPQFANKKPTLFIAHGMPEAMLFDEMAYDGCRGFALKEHTHHMTAVGKDKEGNEVRNKINTGRNMEFTKEFPLSTFIMYLDKPYVRGTVTFWPRHKPIWDAYHHDDKFCELVPQGIDLDRYSPVGQAERFGEPEDINAIYAEMYRYMKNPYFAYAGLARTHEKYKNLRLYGFGCKDGQVMLWSNILRKTKWQEWCPKFGPIHKDIQKVYRGNDFCVSPVSDMSRVAKEAMACGMPVMSKCKDFTDYTISDDIYEIEEVGNRLVSDILDDRDATRTKARKIAEENFDINRTAAGMMKVYERTVGDDKWQT